MEKGPCYWLDANGNCTLEYNQTKQTFPCRKRPSVCEDYAENFLNEPVYKVGDMVWFFDSTPPCPKIMCCKIANMTMTSAKFPLYHIYEDGLNLGEHSGRELFPTKEALCEYYREIFK